MQLRCLHLCTIDESEYLAKSSRPRSQKFCFIACSFSLSLGLAGITGKAVTTSLSRCGVFPEVFFVVAKSPFELTDQQLCVESDFSQWSPLKPSLKTAGHHLAQCEQCSHTGFPGPPLKSHIKSVQSTSVTVRTANRPATEEKRWHSGRQRLGSRHDALLSPNAMMACNA